MRHQHRTLIFTTMLTMLVIGLSSVWAPLAGAIARGYATNDKALRPGLLVALSTDSTPEEPKVERASAEHAERIIGVATTVSESLLTVSGGDEAVYVETEGELAAYVSNVNGDVKQGDLLTISPFKGILMKSSGAQAVVAIALQDFSRDKAETYSIKDNQGEAETLVSKIKVNLDQKALSYELAKLSDSSLERLGRSVVGKEVSEIRVVTALIIFFIVLISEGSIIYGAVSSAITSLGRNPMARNIIRRELVRVLLIAFAVLGIGVGAVYAVLWI